MNDTDRLPEAVEAALAELLHAQLLLGVATAKRRPTADAPEVLAASKALVAVCDAVRAALAQQPAADDRWNAGYKHGLWQGQNCAQQPAASGEPTDAQVAMLDPWMRPAAARELLLMVLAAPQPASARVPLTEAHVEANSPASLSHAHWFRLGVRWAEGQHYINGTGQATPEQGEPK